MSDYAELHCHSAYSLLDGASLPEELVGRAVELGYRYLALTDHDGLYGAMEFARAARVAGINPITGAELTLVDGSHLTLLVESATGYSNLCRLITSAHAIDPAGPWPSEPAKRVARLDPALFATHAEGLVLLTGCRLGQLSRLVDGGDPRGAEALLRQYLEWFGPNHLYVELQHNQVYGDTPRLARLSKLAARLHLPVVATGNVHYHRRERQRLQDVMVAIRHRGSLDATERQHRPNGEFALRSHEELTRLFAAYPEAVRNSVVLAERCAAFDLSCHLPYQFPEYPRQPWQTLDDLLAQKCLETFAQRYSPDHERYDAAVARLEEELALIAQQDLAGFFLLHGDLLELAQEVAVEVRAEQGRAAASPLPPGRGR